MRAFYPLVLFFQSFLPKINKNMSGNFIRFSIGAKLVTIITFIILVSLGTITFLVYVFIRHDIEQAAMKNNLETNRRSAAETEHTLSLARSASLALIQTVNAAEAGSELAVKAADYFFEQNTTVVAILFPAAGNADNMLLVNDRFFRLHSVETYLAQSYYESNRPVYARAAAGESVLLNVSPYFSIHLLALFFPLNEGGAFSILFSPENLNDSFSYGDNQTFLINAGGDILIHPDIDLRYPANAAERAYVRAVLEDTAQYRQYVRKDEGVRYLIAYTKLRGGASAVITSIDYDRPFEGINAVTRRNLYVAAAVLFFSLLFIRSFSKSISRELETLAEAAGKIESGVFEVELTTERSDEIGYLTSGFQRMSKALSTFGRFTNREIALKAMRGEIKPGGLQKHTAVLFSDIIDFTEKTEKFTKEFGREAPDKLVLWLNNYLTRMADCVEKTGGFADKFISGALMAHWGTVSSAGTPAKDAFNCVKAALMMRKALVIMNRDRKPGDAGNPRITAGCGIDTGAVTAGQIGPDLRAEYTVIGGPVNLASEIRSLNKPLGADILISEDTWKLVKYFFITEEMPPLSVRGRENPARIFAVVNHVSVTSGPRTLAEVRNLLGITPAEIYA